MINFLPEQYKRSVKKEYLLRVVSIFLMSIFIVFAIGSGFLFPSYIFSMYKNRVITDQLNRVNSPLSNNNDYFSKTQEINNEVKALINSNTTKSISDTLKLILGLRGSNVHIFQITVAKENSSSKISLRGLSETREGLIKYAKDLKNLNTFDSVDLPVSYLIKNSDVDFVINIISKK